MAPLTLLAVQYKWPKSLSDSTLWLRILLELLVEYLWLSMVYASLLLLKNHEDLVGSGYASMLHNISMVDPIFAPKLVTFLVLHTGASEIITSKNDYEMLFDTYI